MMILAIIMVISCSKKNSGGVTPPPIVPEEVNIKFSIDPDPGSSVAVALGSTYNFKVNVSSKLPTGGVKVDIITKKDADNSVIGSRSFDSVNPAIDLTTVTLNAGILYKVTIVVTSKTKISNTSTKSFKVARK